MSEIHMFNVVSDSKGSLHLDDIWGVYVTCLQIIANIMVPKGLLKVEVCILLCVHWNHIFI